MRLIIVGTESEADDILKEIRQGKQFAFLAKERSVHPSSDRYGDLGNVPLDDFEKPLADALEEMKEGETSGVIIINETKYVLAQIVDLSYYRRGARAFRAGDYRAAEGDLLKHVALNPDAVKARVMLGVIYQSRKEDDNAVQMFKDAVMYGPVYEDAYHKLGKLYLQRKQFSEAKALYLQGLGHLPENAAFMAGLKNAESGIAAIEKEKAKKEEKQIPVVKEKMTEQPEHRGTPHTAREPEQTVHLRIIIVASEAEANDVLSEIAQGRHFALLARERSLDENSREEYGRIGEVKVDSLEREIRAALPGLGEGQTSGVIDMGGQQYAIVQVSTDRYYASGEKAFIAEDYKTAERDLLKHLELNPEAVKARVMLGKMYEDREEYEKAELMYRVAITYDRKTSLLYERLGRMYLTMGRFQRAKDTFEEGLKYFPYSDILTEGAEIADILLIREGKRVP